MDLFEGMLQKDRDEFRRVCNKLMSICFIVKRNEATKSDYYFILRKKEVFERYLDVLGYTLEINEDYGVIQLVNRENYNHVNLRLNDSIILLILRILYDEKKRELSLTDVVVNLGDIQEKYLSLKIRDKQIDKTTMGNALRLFRRYNLIEILDRELNQEDSRIIIYDSILMAIRVEDIRRVYELLEKYRSRGQETAAPALKNFSTVEKAASFFDDRGKKQGVSREDSNLDFASEPDFGVKAPEAKSDVDSALQSVTDPGFRAGVSEAEFDVDSALESASAPEFGVGGE